MFTKEDLGSILGMIEFTWQGGGVRSEEQAMAVHNLKAKTQQLLQNPAALAALSAPTPPAGDEKKKCGKCGGNCGDCGNCGDEKKHQKKPDGPPKAKTEPKEEAKVAG